MKILAFTALLALSFATHAQQHQHHQHADGHGPAIGEPGDPAKVDRTITIEMRDPAVFSPNRITVRSGETVRIVAVNKGKRVHELVLGTGQYLREHKEMMQSHGDAHPAEPHMVRLKPGETGVIVWRFTVPGDYDFACFVDDHFELGMSGTVQVEGEGAHAHDHGHGTAPHDMRGALGPYPMAREGSGTSWLPDDTPHQGIHAMLGDWSTMTHGFANLIYDKQGGPRGDSKTFSTSMLMVMGQREAGSGTLGARGMISLDPLMGKSGYPLLLQTGESANGQPLIDRQHPHDLFMELALSYSRKLSETSSAFIYAGLPGEPALGPPAFMHRLSGEDNPEAPISHHWLDSTHITYGVVTLGYVYGGVKLEGSVFRGREPDENRYDIETGKLDSASARLSWNPTRQWALQVSYGRIKSPEELHPDVDVDRTTASAIYQAGRTQTTLAWGRNSPRGSHGHATNVYLLESSLRWSENNTFFARAELAEKDELVPDNTFRVGKLSLGYVYDILFERTKVGFGGLISRYRIPSELKDEYGNPTSFMLFARVKIK